MLNTWLHWIFIGICMTVWTINIDWYDMAYEWYLLLNKIKHTAQHSYVSCYVFEAKTFDNVLAQMPVCIPWFISTMNNNIPPNNFWGFFLCLTIQINQNFLYFMISLLLLRIIANKNIQYLLCNLIIYFS